MAAKSINVAHHAVVLRGSYCIWTTGDLNLRGSLIVVGGGGSMVEMPHVGGDGVSMELFSPVNHSVRLCISTIFVLFRIFYGHPIYQKYPNAVVAAATTTNLVSDGRTPPPPL